MGVSGTGTHLSTSLQDLQKLGVDTIAVAGAGATVDLGALGSGVDHGGLSGGSLPEFVATVDTNGDGTIDGDDIGVTLNLSGSDLQAQLTEVVGLADQLHTAGIDYIGINGAGVGSLNITDAQAATLVGAGLAFSADDHIGMGVSGTGTHLSTSLQDLQKLGVDTIAVAGAGATVDLAASSLDAISHGALPSFTSLADVTLHLGLAESGLLPADSTIYTELYGKGIDHLAINQALDVNGANWLDLSLLDSIHTQSDLTFEVIASGSQGADHAVSLDANLHGIDLLHSYTTPAQFGDLVKALAQSGVSEVLVDSGNVQVTDALAKALIDGGMMQALPAANVSLIYEPQDRATFNIDHAQTAVDHLYTTLSDMASLGVDHFDLSAATSVDKVYIDLGLPVNDANALTDIKSLLNSLDPLNHATPVFDSSTTSSALVMDSGIANSITTGGHMDASVIDGLIKLGITEIDVLVAAGQTAPTIDTSQSGVTVNLIGASDPSIDPMLYDYLHNKHTL
jgi:hypothetical protein